QVPDRPGAVAHRGRGNGGLMSALGRRGYTLVELIIALVLLGIVSGAIYQVLVNNQRVYQAQTQQIDLQENLRAATTVLPAEFRELDAVDGDIQSMTPTSIQIRAMRKLGFLCTARSPRGRRCAPSRSSSTSCTSRRRTGCGTSATRISRRAPRSSR